MEALQQVANQLGIDQTFLPLFGLVFLLYLVLSTVYLKPFQKLLHDRKEKTEGAKKEALELVQKAEEKLAQYKASLKGTNESAKQVISKAEDEARREEARILGEASTKAKSALQAIQKDLNANRN